MPSTHVNMTATAHLTIISCQYTCWPQLVALGLCGSCESMQRSKRAAITLHVINAHDIFNKEVLGTRSAKEYYLAVTLCDCCAVSLERTRIT